MKNKIKFIVLFLLINSALVKAQTTYNEVASIFYSHCSECHNSKGIAPFPIMSYDDAFAWSSSIYNTVNNNEMPPWQPDTAYYAGGNKAPRFLHENVLTVTEKNAILDWVNDGALEGDPNLAPEAPKYGDIKYKLNGNPDLTLKIPDFLSNASSTLTDPYNCFTIPTGLTEDRWLRAFEVVPGNFNIVHHVVVTVDTLANTPSNLSGNCISQGGQYDIIVWNPGAAPIVFPSKEPLKTGIRIPKGSNLILQIHYAPGTGGQLDSTKIRMFFYPEEETGIREMYSATLLQNWGIAPGINFGPPPIPKNTITPHKANSSTSPLVAHPVQPTTDFCVYSVNPHSHKVCSEIKNYAYSGTDTIPLIYIPRWNYKWEGNYFFPKPVKIPAGYTLEGEHVYDNTTSNPFLGGPPQDTEWGTKNSEEMLFDGFLYFDYQPGDENIDLKAIVETDTLLKTDIEKKRPISFQYQLYPNPATEHVSIYLSTKSIASGAIYTITGQFILKIDEFKEKTTIPLNKIPSGIYLIELIDSNSMERVTKKLVVN